MKRFAKPRGVSLAVRLTVPSLVLGAGVAACGSCSKTEGSSGSDAASAVETSVVAEALPRCRGEAQRLLIPGENVVVGDVAIGPGGLLVGLVRSEGGKAVASVLRTGLDLGAAKTIDVGPALGDDPPPSPRWNAGTAWLAFLGRQTSDGGPRLRTLKVARLEDGALGKVEATILQQADESTAFDVAWSETGGGLAAWDEDAPRNADAAALEQGERGFVKVLPLGVPPDSDRRPRIASPETSDAESPRLLPRPGGGFWLAWLARRVEDDSHYVEGPGEKRAYRWVEVTTLDAKGDTTGPVRRVSPEKGRVVAFELARSGADLVVMAQDEAAPSEGAGARIVRYVVSAAPSGKDDKDRAVAASDVVDGGVGHALAELVPVSAPGESARWLAWTDTAERAHLTPLGLGLGAAGRSTAEPTLDGARVLAAVASAAAPAPSAASSAPAPPPAGEAVYALVGASPTEKEAQARPELRRFFCK